MQEAQVIRVGRPSPEVHLRRATGLPDQQARAQRQRDGDGAIDTAAIHHRQLTAGELRAQVGQLPGDARLFVQYRYDKAHSGGHYASSAPPQLLPWPAAQP